MNKTLIIEGMSCGHCVNHVENAIKDVKGVETVSVNLEDKTAHVILEDSVTETALVDAVSEAGYKVIDIK
ncbi:MAG: heavy-metal-associated domain-containing protein [Vallitalea sp.]|nr:heavy-metal-associated domain-containing protein [Vallitalea sp.]